MAWLSKSLFILVLVSVSVLGLSMNSPFLTWGCMEINMLLFIPILGFSLSSSRPHMLGMKYFFIQSLASIILFFSILLSILLSKSSLPSIIFTLMIMWKMGLPPFHLWLFSVMSELDWMLFFMLASWQKLMPLYMLSQTQILLLDYIILFSLAVSATGSMFQVSMKKMLIVSSIFTGAWILASMSSTKMLWMMILGLYSLMLFFCVLFLQYSKVNSKDHSGLSSAAYSEKLSIFILFMAMAGLPPFLGFFMKLSVLMVLIMSMKISISMWMILTSVIMIYMYAGVFLSSLMTHSAVIKTGLTQGRVRGLGFISMIYFSAPLLFFFL